MKHRIIIVEVFLFVSITGLHAQYDFNNLLDSLKRQIGSDEFFLEDFSTCLHRSDTIGSVPMARFPMRFEKETTYRLRVLSDQTNYEPCAILQVLEGHVLKGSNYAVKQKKCYNSFDFANPFNRDGELVIYFVDGKDGCAVAIISKLVNQ